MAAGPQGLRGVAPGGMQYTLLGVVVEVGVVHAADAAPNIMRVIPWGARGKDDGGGERAGTRKEGRI